MVPTIYNVQQPRSVHTYVIPRGHFFSELNLKALLITVEAYEGEEFSGCEDGYILLQSWGSRSSDGDFYICGLLDSSCQVVLTHTSIAVEFAWLPGSPAGFTLTYDVVDGVPDMENPCDNSAYSMYATATTEEPWHY